MVKNILLGMLISLAAVRDAPELAGYGHGRVGHDIRRETPGRTKSRIVIDDDGRSAAANVAVGDEAVFVEPSAEYRNRPAAGMRIPRFIVVLRKRAGAPSALITATHAAVMDLNLSAAQWTHKGKLPMF
ncbi:hypothetical protein ACSBOB_06965 [Mesorhizobium sp. ASY16-5R]|uniref:hypothetical protein n=1 Tax=Mesorhizobium sp. ASY16-5R TaxID=3445772 RepID=UPI003F9EDA21